jgi:hypothetical protein
MPFKYLVFGCIFLFFADTASIEAQSQGFLEGHLKIIFGMAVGPSDDMPRQSVTAENYAEYPLVVLSEEEKKEVARVTADQNGNYRVALSPGKYVLDVQDRVHKRLRARPQAFTVTSNQTAHVDMNIIIGMRRVL